MRRTLLAATTALCMLGAPQAHAALIVTNPISDFLSQTLNDLQVAATHAVEAAVAAMSQLQNTTLISGFNQISNYLKGQTASSIQIADASNTVNAMFARSLHNSEIVAAHAVSPAACLALDMSQSASVASSQADRVTLILANVTDPRGEGAPSTPAFGGAAQAAEANRTLHLRRYCSQLDVEAGLCSAVSELENGDTRAASLFGHPTYPAQADLDAANDYATTILQPTPPSPLRGDARSGVNGAQATQRRRNYDGRMSLARWVLNSLVGAYTSSVQLTSDQQAQQRLLGRTATANGSLYDVLDLEVTRRFGNQAWNVALERMPSDPVILREIARQNALQAYLSWFDIKMRMQENALLAAQVGADAERDLRDPRFQSPSAPYPVIGAR